MSTAEIILANSDLMVALLSRARTWVLRGWDIWPAVDRAAMERAPASIDISELAAAGRRALHAAGMRSGRDAWLAAIDNAIDNAISAAAERRRNDDALTCH